jgi:hypothetical protein
MLDSTVLKNDLVALLSNGAGTPEKAAEDWATIYSKYAANAVGWADSPVILASTKSALQGTLLAQFATPSISYDKVLTTSLYIASALQTFWLVPPVNFVIGVVPSSVVTVVAGTTALDSSLKIIFNARAGTWESQAQLLALAIDMFTKTVIVTQISTGFPKNLT